jgi:hypothetical protein
MGGAPPQRLPVGLTRASNVARRYRGEGHHLYRLDLYLPGADAVKTSDLDLSSPPQTKRDGDVPGQHPFSQLGAELHRVRLRQGFCRFRTVDGTKADTYTTPTRDDRRRCTKPAGREHLQ